MSNITLGLSSTVTAPVNAVYRFHEGKVAEVWMTMDMAGIQQQLETPSEEEGKR